MPSSCRRIPRRFRPYIAITGNSDSRGALKRLYYHDAYATLLLACSRRWHRRRALGAVQSAAGLLAEGPGGRTGDFSRRHPSKVAMSWGADGIVQP